MQPIKILPTITTSGNSDWQNKIVEIKKLKLKEVFVFLTGLEEKERKELYKSLQKTEIEKIPFVHLRSDMKLEELDYLVENYKTEIFNLHTEKQYPLLYDYSKYKNIITIENKTAFRLDEEEIKNYAGICLDISHLENVRLLDEKAYEHDVSILEKYPIKCNHISAIQKKGFLIKGRKNYACHYLRDMSELNYLKKYPLKYFSNIIAIELENSIKEQLEIREHIINLIKNK